MDATNGFTSPLWVFACLVGPAVVGVVSCFVICGLAAGVVATAVAGVLLLVPFLVLRAVIRRSVSAR